jgi:GTP pyrophosphokinase
MGECPMNIETLIQQVLNYSPESDPEFLRAVYSFAAGSLEGHELAPGIPGIDHALGTAMVLTRLQLGEEAVAAALLHDLLQATDVAPGTLRGRFGEDTTRLVESTARLNRISWGRLEREKAPDLRRLFLAMVDDVRVVMIRLAEQLNLMYSLSFFSESVRRQNSEESLHIFAPLADRLGIRSFKWELEDLALQQLEPEQFSMISGFLSERRDSRERTIRAIITTLQDAMRRAGISGEITGRPKHITGIFKKMESTRRGFEEIYDVQAVRIIVKEVKDCYAALDIVHGLWPPIPGEYDDYIAVPKPNMYRSLHTAVNGPRGRALEIQIRTGEMHRTAEWGIAAHWMYKEKAGRDISVEAKVAYLRGLLAWQRDLFPEGESGPPDQAVPLVRDVFVLTPEGDILALPEGATPLDFAYAIHTQVGHRCRGAKVNGKMVTLDHRLQSGDRVEVLTGKKSAPSRDWLNPRHGFIRTQRARRDIRLWFLSQERDEFVARGREMADRTLKRLGERVRDYEKLAVRFGFSRAVDFLEAVGRGKLSAEHIRNRLAKTREEGLSPTVPESTPLQVTPIGVTVTGMGDLLTRVARCCSPLPGDRITGYITRGRGITIHRRDCHNIRRLPDRDRLADVSWDDGTRGYAVPIQVVGGGSQKLLKDVAKIVEEEKARLLGTNVRISPTDRLQTLLATLEISSASQLKRILARVKGLPSVSDARRVL